LSSSIEYRAIRSLTSMTGGSAAKRAVESAIAPWAALWADANVNARLTARDGASYNRASLLPYDRNLRSGMRGTLFNNWQSIGVGAEAGASGRRVRVCARAGWSRGFSRR
jgi:hypothetical protein